MNSSLKLHKDLQVFEQVPDLYLILSPELIILTASDAYLKATHTIREEIVGKHMFDVFPDNPMATAANAVKNLNHSLQQVLNTKKPHRMAVQHYDVPLPAKPGGFAEKYWLPLNTPILDEQGQVQYIIHKVDDVTEKFITQNKLKREFRHLKDAQAIGHIGSFERLVSEDIITCSNEWYRIHGLEPQSEVITLDTMYSFFHPEDRQETQEAVENTIATGEPLHLVSRIVRADGIVRYVQRRAEIFKDEQGKAYKIYGIVQDVTEQVEARKRVETHEALLRATEEIAHLGSYELDVATMTIRFSDGLYRLFGEAPQSFLPSLAYIEKRSHPDDVQVVKEVLEQAIQTKKPYQYTRRIRRKDGAWRTLEAKGNVVCDDEGNLVKLIGLVQDATDRIKAEQELKQSRELLKTTIDSSLDMIQVFKAVRNKSGEIIDFNWILNNQTSERIYGDVIGKSLLQHNPGVVAEGIFDAFKQVVETGIPDQSERHYMYEQFDGWFHQSTVKLQDGIATTTHDITERKKAERELLQSKNLLQGIIDAPNVGMAVYKAVRDSKGNILNFVHEFVNKRTLEALGGYDMTGKLLSDHGEAGSQQLNEFCQVLATGKVSSYVIQRELLGTNRWILISNARLDSERIVHVWDDITEQKEKEQEVLRLKDEIAQRATDKYHVLFDTIEEGLAICSVVRNAEGKAVDLRYEELNHALEQQTGLIRHNIIGRKLSEVFSKVDADHWLPLYSNAADTGKMVTFEAYADLLKRWYNVSVYPREEELFVFYRDITERKQQEKRQSLLIKLNDAIRPLTDPIAIMATVSEIIGRHYEVGRCGYAEVPPPYDHLVVERDWTNGVMQSLVGRHPLSGFGDELIRQYRTGKTIVVEDAFEDSRNEGKEEGLRAAGNIRSSIAVQLMKEGVWVATFYVQDTVKRIWTTDEVELMEEIAERTWAALERAKAEKVLAISEEKYRNLFNSMDEGYCIIQLLYDETGKAIDFRYLQVNQAFERTTGLHNAQGKTIRELAPNIEPKWMEIYDQVARTGKPLRFEEGSEALQHIYSLYAFRFGDPAERKVAVIFADITENKKAEEALRLSEQQLQNLNATLEQQVTERTYELSESKLFAEQITQATPDFIMIFNLLDNKVEFVNQSPYSGNNKRYHETLHIRYDQLMSRSHPDDRQKLYSYIDKFRTASDDKAYTLEYRVIEQGKTIWYRSRGKVFRRNEAGIPTHYISVVQDISDLKQLEQENLQMRLEQQRTHLLAIMEAQEEERRRISEGLHNGVGQILYSAKLHLNRYLEQYAAKSGTDNPLYQIDYILGEAIRQTRGLSHELAPALLEQFGLKAAFKEIGSSLSTPSLNIQCLVYNLPEQLEKHLQIVIYRVAQELANNIIKHSNATEASLLLSTQRQRLVLVAEDNGQGFNPTNSLINGIGLGSIKNRVELLNGTLHITSAPGQGTQIRITLPLLDRIPQSNDSVSQLFS